MEVSLSDHDPSWPEAFQQEAERIQAALRERAIRIEHVGSTAVASLIAKPVIDVVLVVADSSDEPAYVPDLEAAGYTLLFREPEWYEHRLFRGPDTEVNLHVFSNGCEEIEKMLTFRDRLRSDATDRDLYARRKLALAQRQWQTMQDYANAKASVVAEILARAATQRG